MPIKNYTTRIPAVQTVGEIQGILAAHGARKVMMDYAENGKVTAVTFALECCGSLQGFRLEARPDGVKTVMERERLKCDDAKQIETVADALGCGEEFSALLARHTKDGQQQIDIS